MEKGKEGRNFTNHSCTSEKDCRLVGCCSKVKVKLVSVERIRRPRQLIGADTNASLLPITPSILPGDIPD